MRSIIMALILFGTVTANAETVTVDFNEFPTVFGESSFDSKGFRFTSDGSIVSLGNFLGSTRGTSLAMLGGNDMALLGDGTFSLESFVMTRLLGAVGDVVVIGNFKSGGQISTTLSFPSTFNFEFGETWQGLTSVEFNSANNSLFYIDDIVTNVVPIPAAAWLFGSALAGLGWLRRKQTV
jgi:hypothetical protein